MAIDLINITNIVLINDFETWLKRSNEVIDALNPLQIYDFYDNFYTAGDLVSPTIPGFTGLSDLTEATTLGLKITRDIRFDGDMLIEVFPEAPLGFNSVTGRLALNFSGPSPPGPPVLGTDCLAPNRVENDDRYVVHDTSATLTKVVEASNMLPPVINCDHQFGTSSIPGPGFVTITIKGDLIVDGTTTTLSTLNLEVEDNNINLNHDGSGTPGVPGGPDTSADGGGITLLSTDGNKIIEWRNTGDRWFVNQGWEVDQNFSLFTTTIEPQLNLLTLLGSGSPLAVSLTFQEVGVPAEEWRFNLNNFGLGQSRYVVNNYPSTVNVVVGAPDGTFELEHVGAPFPLTIVFDSSTTTNDPSIRGFAERLNADLLDGCHASATPTPFFIPCADVAGQIDPGWIPNTGNIRKDISQTGHGLVKGNVVRVEPIFGNYVLAQANNETNAESVGIVSNVVDLDNFELTLLGCISNLAGEPSHVLNHSAGAGPGGLFTPGQAYFLSVNEAGAFTITDVVDGDVQKTVLIATSTTDAIITNYVGGQTEITTGPLIVELTNDVLGSALLGSPIVTTIVERTLQISTSVVDSTLLPLAVEDSIGAGNRTFDITMLANNVTLELQEPLAADWNAITTPDFHTNSVTLIINQGGAGGFTPIITVNGAPPIIWDNSVSQPLVQLDAGKTTIYVLINVTNNPGVWYGSRAVFEL